MKKKSRTIKDEHTQRFANGNLNLDSILFTISKTERNKREDVFFFKDAFSVLQAKQIFLTQTMVRYLFFQLLFTTNRNLAHQKKKKKLWTVLEHTYCSKIGSENLCEFMVQSLKKHARKIRKNSRCILVSKISFQKIVLVYNLDA